MRANPIPKVREKNTLTKKIARRRQLLYYTMSENRASATNTIFSRLLSSIDADPQATIPAT
jgi:hypothetical protein